MDWLSDAKVHCDCPLVQDTQNEKGGYIARAETFMNKEGVCHIIFYLTTSCDKRIKPVCKGKNCLQTGLPLKKI